MSVHRKKGFIALLAALLLGAPAFAQEAQVQYLRRTETPNGVISLEIASRDFVPGEDAAEADGPRVALVGVAHIGDGAFYRDVSKLLKDYDIVLYEAVRPSGVEAPRGETDDERMESTERAARFVASVIEAHRAERGRYPDSLDEVREFARQVDPMIVNWLENALTDAWGRPLNYGVAEEGTEFTLTSEGGPGRDGASVIVVSHEDAVPPLALDWDNIQKQLATALGLAYQLEALDYGSPNWRSSDMSIDDLSQAFRDRGLEFAPLQGTLGGSSLPAQLGKLLLRMITMLDAMAEGAISDIVKVLMIELLSDESLLEHGLGQLGEGFGDIIINQRNQVVMDDLKRLIGEEPGIRSVAILYGAGHMADLAERLRDQMGYEPGEERWLKAISVDLRASRVDQAQVAQMRRMLQRALQQQMPARRRER